MPRIAAITPVKRRPRERRILLEDGDEYVVLADTLVVLGIAEGDLVADARMAELLDRDSVERAKALAWRLVGSAPRTRKQVAGALAKRKLPRKAIEEAIAVLERTGCLDERAYAAAVVEMKGRAAGQGPLLVEARLEESGVPRPVREEALRGLVEDQRALAEAALAKWLASRRGTDPRKLARAAAEHLARRGFDPEVVWEVVEAVVPGGSSGE